MDVPLVSPELTAILWHLSGRRRGRLDTLSVRHCELSIDVDGEMHIQPVGAAHHASAIARLHKTGPTYELEVAAEGAVKINGEPVLHNRLLCSGDLVEFGPGGRLLRYRLYPPGETPTKSVREALSDSLDGARADGSNSLGRFLSLIARFACDLATRTSVACRATVLSLVSGLIAVSAYLTMQ